MTTESKTEKIETTTDSGDGSSGGDGDGGSLAAKPSGAGAGNAGVPLVAVLVAIGGVILLAITAVALMSKDDDVATISGGDGTESWHGVVIDPPQPRPEFTLTDTDGRPFDFAAETSGELTLLFLGYTHCPDICPVQMAVVGSALEKPGVPSATVVFVTTDPARDTPERLREWLDQMPGGEQFVGLTGSLDQIAEAEAAAGVAGSIVPAEGTDEDYEVGHAAQILAYTPDDLGHLAYPAGVRSEDWLADLPRMIDRWGSGSDSAAAGSGDDDGADPSGSDSSTSGDGATSPATAGDLTVGDAFASTSDTSSAVYLTIDNTGDDDTLVGASSPAAGQVTIMQSEPGGSMTEGADIDVPTGTTELANGGVHVMLEDLPEALEAGDTVELDLEFERAGTVTVEVEILAWSDMVERIESAP